MSQEIKFLSLQKPELVYEVAIRGETPADTVIDLRKQIGRLGIKFPSEDILASPFDTSEDLKSVQESIERLVKSVVSLKSAPSYDKALFGRSKNLARHISFRLCRIDCSASPENLANLKKILDSFNKIENTLNKVESELNVDEPSTSKVSLVGGSVGSPTEIIVTCDRGLSNDLLSLKYNGKTCVRAFIKRVSEIISAKNIPPIKVLNYATEIFTDDALHWFRSLEGSVASWDDVCQLLKLDFSQPDYDYKFLEEIKLRTQGEKENITIYIAIMTGMFSQLDKTLNEQDKLDILLHNIRPCYAGVLSSAGEISSIQQLHAICKNFENVQCRFSSFHEPPKVSASTMAPNFAYTRASHSYDNLYNKGFSNQTYNKFNNQSNSQLSYNSSNYKSTSTPKQFTESKNVHAVKRKLFCPRCRVDSHGLRECTAERKIICFRCGRPDYRHYDCPDCQGLPSVGPKNE